jgi:hypothetical protein
MPKLQPKFRKRLTIYIWINLVIVYILGSAY